ncbi:MAG: hypothetical protein ACF8XB_09725 [Planctomycetota bacterium JB042]
MRVKADKKDWFSYPLVFNGNDGLGLGNGEQQTLSIQIQNNHAFLFTHAVAYVTQFSGAGDGLPFLAQFGAMTGGAQIASWPLKVKIFDAGSQLSLMNDEVPLAAVFGDGNRGVMHELPLPRLFAPNTSIQVTLRRFAEGQVDEAGAATTEQLQADLVFAGYRLFDTDKLHLTG